MTIGHYLVVEGLLGILALLALVVWIVAGRRRRAERARDRAADPFASRPTAADRAELEAAEREVRDLDDADSDGDRPGDDWGPGTYHGPRR